ncbi:MAG: response regulator, partial [Lachnospiraceae bacterium]|nr:response regulator [Lachnospiraceae bacterium]
LRANKPDNLELIIDVDPAIPSMMNTDVSKLKKIMHHLITNGLKYTREGGVYVRVSTTPEKYGVNLQIEVTDTGIGMTYEEQERIFERFYQADSGRSRSESGLGLGMAIVQGFVASLGGFILLKSKPGEGTSVHISLPQKTVDETGCMTLAHRDDLCIGAFLHFDKFAHPVVREYYNSMVRNIVRGLGVQMHRVDNAANLEKLRETVHLTHLFVAEEEYDSAPELLEDIGRETLVVVVANSDFKLPAGSNLRIMEKPFYCFPVVSILNTTVHSSEDDEDRQMYCEGIEALVVDDEPMNLTVARNILRRYGMVVSTAASGNEAINMCRKNAYDIVFMDHMMPGMDGIEAMKLIRADKTGRRSDLPVVALTANAVSTARSMFMAEGFDGFVSKPIELIELERVLKNVLPKSAITYRSKADISFETPNRSDKSAAAPIQTETGKAVSLPAQSEAGKPAAAPDAAAGTDTSDIYARLNACGIDTKTALGYCAQDGDFYRQLLAQFVSESGEKLKRIGDYYAAMDLPNYEILVHALKSNAKMIGITHLSEQAKELEFAAKEKRSDYITAHNDPVMEEYRQKVSEISYILGIEADDASGADDEVLDFAPSGDSEGKNDDEVLTFEPTGQ